eukprot:PITA_21938
MRSLDRYTGYIALVRECVETDPYSFEEAVQQPIWVDAMVEEYDSIVRNSVWDVVPRPENKLVVSSRWLYKVKEIDYDETFAPVVRLKEAPRAWYTRIDNYFTGLGFTKSEANANLYHIMVEGNQLINVLYVDDLILTGDDQLIMSCNRVQDERHGSHALLSRHGSVAEGWGVVYVSRQLSQAMVQPTKLFWKVAKHVLRYLRGTYQYGLWYKQSEGVKLQGFTYVDWARSPSNRKRTSRGIFNLGSATVSWYNRKQRSVALSSVEDEYMSTSQAACEPFGCRKF